MSTGQTASHINWSSLVEAINNEECILVLGPNIAAIEVDGVLTSLHKLLAQQLADKIKQLSPNTQLLDTQNLAYVAQQLEQVYIAKKYKEGRARATIRELIQTFYEQYDFTQFPIYTALAKLPFRFIVNTNPDHFLLDAYHDENKFSAETEFYHYGNPSHNNAIDNNEDFSPPNIDAPLVFNLFGSAEQPDSLIVTAFDQLLFIDTILQKERTAGIPNKIAIEFTSSKKKDFEKTYVFLGFDFNQWHLRLLTHLINRYEKQKEGYVLQNPKSVAELTAIFYKNDFEMAFVDTLPISFAHTLSQKIIDFQPTQQASPKLNAVLIFDENDKDIKDTFDIHLSLLKRNEFIQTWDEQKIMIGSERDAIIEEKIDQADIILMLVTSNLFRSDDIYEKQLQRAVSRHEAKETVVIPILMRSCLWQSSIIGGLSSSILPGKNKTPLLELTDQTLGLANTIKALENWCKKIYKRKNRKLN